MLCFQTDFEELKIDGLIDTSALSSAIPEADLREIRILVPHTKKEMQAFHLSTKLWLPMDN